MRTFRSIILFIIVTFWFTPISGKVLRIIIEKRELILEGISWSETGPYELLEGTVVFGFDPNNRFNRQITDIELAPVNEDGLVIATSDLVVLRPANTSVTPLALVEVSNRGGKFTPSLFLNGSGNQMRSNNPEVYGDGLLLKNNVTLIWIGWQFDVPDQENLLNFFTTEAKNTDGSPIVGRVRSDWTVDSRTHNLKLGHRDQTGYPVYGSRSRALLTRRTSRDGPRNPISMQDWRFGRIEDGKYTPDKYYICSEEGFDEGYVYELVYQGSDPPVVGLGLAAIRDIISYVKYDPECLFHAEKGIAAGVSQTGRFLRHFMYQGFNQDEEGRKAYDGMMIMTAGAGRGSFNHRFAQPSRDGHPYSAFFYPTDIFPFSSTEQRDQEIDIADGLLASTDADFLPRIFYVNTGYEYWGRAASLIHTSIDGKKDIAPQSNERIYHISSAQHYVRNDLNEIFQDGSNVKGNFMDFKVNFRALVMALMNWVVHDQPPPESRYPTIYSGNLVPPDSVRYPSILGIKPNPEPHKAYRINYGSNWKSGIIDHQPPIIGRPYPSLVPQVDPLGNEKSGIRNIEVAVPLGTYIPWTKRTGLIGSPDALRDFLGHFVPFPDSTVGEDSRSSLNQLYGDKSNFLTLVKDSISELIHQGFILPEDASRVLTRNSRYWNWIKKTISDPPDKEIIKAVSYNIRYNNPGDGPNAWPLRKDSLIAQVRSFNADILGFQEALQSQCRHLRKGLKGYKMIGVGREDGKKSGEFAPVFYNRRVWKRLSSGHFWLSQTPDIPSRGWDAVLNRIVTWAELEHKQNSETLFVFNTHLDHLGEEARLQSIYLLHDKIKSIAGNNPVIICGDFNFTPATTPYYKFTLDLDHGRYRDARLYSANKPEGPNGTFTGFEVNELEPERRIDYIFGNDSIHFRTFKTDQKISGNYYLSDHLPVVVEFYIQ